MKTFLASLFLVVVTSIPAQAQKVSAMPETFAIGSTDLIMITVPGVNNYKSTLLTLATNLQGLLAISAVATNAVYSGSNLSVTNSTVFGVFYDVSSTTNMRFFSLKQGTNMVIYRDGSNIVLNATGTGSSAVAGTNMIVQGSTLSVKNPMSLNANGSLVDFGTWGPVIGFSNSAVARLSFYNQDPAAGDDWTLPGLISANNANFSSMPGSGEVVAISAGGTLFKTNASGQVTTAQLNTASNTLFSIETARNSAVSNALASLVVANDNITSNALYSASSSSTQFVVASFGNANVTNVITAGTFNAVTANFNSINVTNGFSSNVVRMALEHLTNVNVTGLSSGDAIVWNGFTWTNSSVSSPTRFTPAQSVGVGGALTNFTFLATQPEVYIAATTNVSLRAVMNYDATKADYWNLIITNGSGSSRTLEFSQVTNSWTFAGTYGTNAPTTLTNNTTMTISAVSRGTNVTAGYIYTKWP